MDSLIYSLGGQKFYLDDLKFILAGNTPAIPDNKGIYDDIIALLNSWKIDLTPTKEIEITPFIITGINAYYQSGHYQISPGWIVYNNQLYYYPGSAVNAPEAYSMINYPITVYFHFVHIDSENRVFKDSTSHEVWRQYRMIINNSSSSVSNSITKTTDEYIIQYGITNSPATYNIKRFSEIISDKIWSINNIAATAQDIVNGSNQKQIITPYSLKQGFQNGNYKLAINGANIGYDTVTFTPYNPTVISQQVGYQLHFGAGMNPEFGYNSYIGFNAYKSNTGVISTNTDTAHSAGALIAFNLGSGILKVGMFPDKGNAVTPYNYSDFDSIYGKFQLSADGYSYGTNGGNSYIKSGKGADNTSTYKGGGVASIILYGAEAGVSYNGSGGTILINAGRAGQGGSALGKANDGNILISTGTATTALSHGDVGIAANNIVMSANNTIINGYMKFINSTLNTYYPEQSFTQDYILPSTNYDRIIYLHSTNVNSTLLVYICLNINQLNILGTIKGHSSLTILLPANNTIWCYYQSGSGLFLINGLQFGN